ncbi:DNA modification methylase [soil metagenome]
MTLKIVYRPLAELQPREKNPRSHPAKQLNRLAKSITRFGFNAPILIDENGRIVAGHARAQAAAMTNLTEVPTICLEGLSPEEIRGYVIADNRIAELGTWDNALLVEELKFLTEVELDFDITDTGFELPEIEGLFAGEPEPKVDPLDAPPSPSDNPPTTQPGDVWQIGPHRLVCGDSRQAETYERLLGDERAALIFTDPPFNVRIDGHVSGLGRTKHREFAMASGEMDNEAFIAFLSTVFGQLTRFSASGSIHYIMMDWRHLREITVAGLGSYSELKNLCVWAKTNGGMGSLYRSAHELVFVFKSGLASHINNVELGKHGRYRTNVWTHPGANTFSRTRDADLAAHPTVKPVGLVADAIRDCSRRKDIVLDPFAGSGTTLVAAQRTGRRGFGIELDPVYCDVIVARMRKAFNLDVRALDGRTFEEVAQERALASSAPGSEA